MVALLSEEHHSKLLQMHLFLPDFEKGDQEKRGVLCINTTETEGAREYKSHKLHIQLI